MKTPFSLPSVPHRKVNTWGGVAMMSGEGRAGQGLPWEAASGTLRRVLTSQDFSGADATVGTV